MSIREVQIPTGRLLACLFDGKIGASTKSISDNFQSAIAAVENAKYALAFSSGSTTTAVILQSLPISSHVISVSDVYGGTHRYFTKVANTHGVDVSFTTTIEKDLERLIQRDRTKLVWVETPSNPTLGLVDIEKVAAIARKYGLLLVVDNTFLSPFIQNPLQHGADIVVHSVTKYINGHSVSTVFSHIGAIVTA